MELSLVLATTVAAVLSLNDVWLSSDVRVKSLVMGYFSKAFEPRVPMVWVAPDLGSEPEGCLWYEDWRRRESATKSEAEARLKVMRNRGLRVGMQAAMIMIFISMLKHAISIVFEHY